MSAKTAVISSMIWLIGWIRPRSAGEERTGSETSSVSAFRRASIAASFRTVLRSVIASVISFFSALIAAPRVWRSSGVIEPKVFRSSETEPFLPRAETRTASIAASSPAPAISARSALFNVSSSVIFSCFAANSAVEHRCQIGGSQDELPQISTHVKSANQPGKP
ncbi:hypothetical protein D3C73_530750 [compost metagenome]